MIILLELLLALLKIVIDKRVDTLTHRYHVRVILWLILLQILVILVGATID
jgi:hypothetical protein